MKHVMLSKIKLPIVFAVLLSLLTNSIYANTQLETLIREVAQSDPIAQYNLGVIYENGFSVQQDNVKALEWYSKSALLGFAEAQHNLAVMYEHGKGTSQNYEKAVQWYTNAAEQDFSNSQYNLGLMYLNGFGVVKNNKKALEWFTKAANTVF